MQVDKFRGSYTVLVLLSCVILTTFGSIDAISQQNPYERGFDVDTVLTGDWTGYVTTSRGMRYRLILHINATTDGVCDVHYDVPDKNWFGQRFSSAACKPFNLYFSSDSSGASFTGAVQDQGLVIEGVWKQESTSSAVRFMKVIPVIRFQEPDQNVGYVKRNFRATNRETGVNAVGQLIVPNEDYLWPVVVLISDRGIQDMDSKNDESGHKPFLVLADALAKRGWASLRLNDQPVSNPLIASEIQLAEIRTAVDRLKLESNINPQRIVLLGHGEGGLTALKLSMELPEVKGVVCAATPAMSGDSLFLHRIVQEETTVKTNPAVIEIVVAMAGKWVDAVKHSQQESLAVRMAAIIDSTVKQHDVELSGYREAYTLTGRDRNVYISKTLVPWILSYLAIDIKRLVDMETKPVLCLLAERDIEVPTTPNLVSWKQLKETNRLIDIHVIDNVNHGFQTCIECTRDESARTAETINDGVIKFLGEWLSRLSN